MKTAKSCKFIFLSAILAICFALSLGMMNLGVARAADELSPSDYFTFDAAADSTIAFDGDALALGVKSGDTLKLKNQLVLSGMSMVLDISDAVEEMTFTLTSDSYGVNGNKNSEGKYDKSIENVLILTLSQDKTEYLVNFNGEGIANVPANDAEGKVSITFNESAGYLQPEVNGQDCTATENEYYRLALKDTLVTVGNFEMEFTKTSGDGKTDVKLISVAQYSQQNAEKYVQTFATNEDKSAFTAEAYPRITLNDSFFNNGVATARRGTEISLTVTAYSVLGNYSASDFYLQESNSDILTNAKKVWFMREGDAADFNVCFKNADEEEVAIPYSVKVYTEVKDGDGTAPVYTADKNSEEYKAFTNALNNSLYSDPEKGIFVAIGSGETITLPSFKQLVADENTSYENMSYTVYYKTPNGQSSSSNLKVPIEYPGKYEFYVVFKDKDNNAMEIKDFYEVKDDEKVFGKYADYVFSFTLEDNYPMEITPASSQGKGYVGTKYTASGFEIKASSYTATYSLYYSKTGADDSWVEIPAVSKVSEEDYVEENGFDYSDIEAIAYDGKLTFTPDRTGYYRIECNVVSSSSVRAETAVSKTIEVSSKPKTVVVDNHWLENNVWSVVFLSIGTLCLIGIIVLLFIKPKDQDAE